jgi:anti-anti-sigma factor
MDSEVAPESEPRGFSTSVDRRDDLISVVVTGEIDLDTTEEFGRVLSAGAGVRRLEVDLSEVSYMDSAGLRSLLTARTTIGEQGGELVVTRASSIVTRLFEIAGVAELLDSSD